MSRIPPVLTVDAVATHLAVDTHTVYRLLATGRLVGFKVGSAWRVTESALLVFMQADAVSAPVPAPAFVPPADPDEFTRTLSRIHQRRFS